MKRIIVFICLIAMLFAISGCGKPSKSLATPTPPDEEALAYVLKEENGMLYMHFSENFLEKVKNESGNPNSGSTQIAAVSALRFSSVAELKNAIETGNFTEENLNILAKRAENGVLEIPHTDKIRDAVLPAGLEIETVSWDITKFEFDIDWGDNNYDAGFITIDLDGGYYDYYFDNYIVNYTSGAKGVISNQIVEDRNAREFIYTNNTGKYKKLLYQIKNNGKIVYILEHYYLDYYNLEHFDSYLSETIPVSIMTFCEDEDAFWLTYFKGFEERPSIEWLTSFGIKEIIG